MTARPALVQWSPAWVGGGPGHRLLVVLAAPGCAYARRTGGCTNCGFPRRFGTGSPVAAAVLLAQAKAALRRIPARASAPVAVELFCSGSYLNPEEIPVTAQSGMLALAAAHPKVAALLVETRPEFVRPGALRRLLAAAHGKPLEVAIGLESADEEIRERRIRKGFTWEEFARAAADIARAKAGLLCYVLLKPIDTPEAEAIADSTATARKVFALGRRLGLRTRVALEPCFVAPRTPLFQAFRQGRYRPPWLWSVFEAVRRIAPLGPVLVGLSDEGLAPPQAPGSCGRCAPRLRRALSDFNRTQELSALGGLRCSCQARWRAELG